MTSSVGSYLEYFGFYPGGADDEGDTKNFINGGFTYAVNDDLQLDILAGFGLNDDAEDFFTGVGISFRN